MRAEAYGVRTNVVRGPDADTPTTEGTTMKEFKCGAIVPGCETVIEGESESAIFDQIASHARDAHGLDEVPPEVIDAIHANIKDRVPANS
jgi:predicted small metal-binding protein